MLWKVAVISSGITLFSSSVFSLEKSEVSKPFDNHAVDQTEIMQPFVIHLDNKGCCSSKVAQTVTKISPDQKLSVPGTLTELIDSTPGVSQNGQGGGIHFPGLIHYKGIQGHLINESFQYSNTRALCHKPLIESSWWTRVHYSAN